MNKEVFEALLEDGIKKGFVKNEKGWIDRYNDFTRIKENTILDLDSLIETMFKRGLKS